MVYEGRLFSLVDGDYRVRVLAEFEPVNFLAPGPKVSFDDVWDGSLQTGCPRVSNISFVESCVARTGNQPKIESPMQ